MTDHQLIARQNVRVFYLIEIVSSLIFIIPVWVAYELQYINLVQLAVIEAIIQGSQLFLELPTGALADLWGKRTTIILGYTASLLAGLVYAFSRNFETFIIYALVLGLGQALISGAREAWIYDSLKAADRESDYTKVTSKGSLIFQLGIAFATLTGGLFGSISIMIPIYLNIFIHLFTLLVFIFAREPRIDTQKFTLKNYLLQTKMGIQEIKKTPHSLRISLFYIAVGGITWASMMIFNATLLTQMGFTATEFGITVATIRIINSLVLFGAISLGKIFNQQRPYLFLSILLIISYLPGLWLTKLLTIFAVAGSIFGSTFRWIVLGKLVNREFSSQNRATAISTLSMAISIIVVILSLLSGPIMAQFDGAKTMYTFMGILSLVFILPLGYSLSRSTRN